MRYRLWAVLFLIIVLTGCNSSGKSNEDFFHKIVSDVETNTEEKNCERYFSQTMDMEVFPSGEEPSFFVASPEGEFLLGASYSQNLYLYSAETMTRKKIYSCAEHEYISGITIDEEKVHFFVYGNDSASKIVSIELDGTLINQVCLSDWQEINDFVVKKLVCDADGYIYLQGSNNILIFSPQQEFVGSMAVDNENTILDCARSKSGRVFLTCENLSRGVCLYSLDRNNISIDLVDKISSNGRLFAGLTNELAFSDSRYFYDYDVDNKKEYIVCDLMDNFINPQNLLVVNGRGTEEFMIGTWDNYAAEGQNPIQCFLLRKMTEAEKQAADKEEKETITIYKTGKSYELPTLILAFQKQYPQYEVIVEENDDALTDAEGFTHTKLLTKDTPDILFIDDENYEIYRDAGALTDLVPFMEKSTYLKQGQFIEKFLVSYQTQGSVYGLPLSYSIRTLVGDREKIGGIQKKSGAEYYEGCTTDRFLNYLDNNPDLFFQFDGDPIGLLRMCLMCNMDKYIDWETNTCSFDNQSFSNLVMRMKNLRFETNFFDINEWKELARDQAVVAEEYIYSFTGILQLIDTYGKNIICFGYPTDDGNLHTILDPVITIGISKNSQHKEAAWDFIEYYYEHSNILGIPADKHRFEEAYRNAEDFMAEQEDLKKRKDKLMELMLRLIDAGEVQTRYSKQIWKIMEEEIPAVYWQGRDLSEVLKIIQSRAQIYLWE